MKLTGILNGIQLAVVNFFVSLLSFVGHLIPGTFDYTETIGNWKNIFECRIVCMLIPP